MDQHLQKILDFIQQDQNLSASEKDALIKSVKDANKELEIISFKLDRTEKVKRTTSILLEETIAELEQKRKAVEAQNKELEIESSLERVRTVAMSMNKPDDMLDVCRIISCQLEMLGTKEIRNVQTAIFYENKGTYINYEYYRLHDKSLVTEVDYRHDTMTSTFASKMLKGAGEFFTESLTGQVLKDWFAYQKTTPQFADPHLAEASSLNYYWFSLGSIALGISTYTPLNDEEINLFKRFRNVFELSYRRFLDIEKAEEQAKEAKVEASLERMRAAAMSMRKSEELISVCEAMYKELTVLGFTNIRNAQIAIKNDTKQSYLVCEYSDYNVAIMEESAYDSSPIVQELYRELEKSGDALYQKEFTGKKFDDWREWRKGVGTSADSRIEQAHSMCFYLYSIGTGYLGISTFNAITNGQVQILKRFRNVFELSYRRYIDVAMAEVQAKEAQIELALERVRARTMAMQKSEELAETSFVLFQQFKDLGETSEQISIGIFKEDEHVMELYSTLYGSQWEDAARVGLDEPVVMKKIHKAWKEQTRLPDGQGKSLVIDITGDDLRQYNAYRKTLSNLEYREDRWVIHVAFFSTGVITFSTANPHPAETIQLLERFAAVFEQTYTRFLDLQKAEAQAREAKIETALERVRSHSLAMHNSSELSEVVDIVFEKLHELNIIFDGGVAIQTFTEDTKDSIIWITDPRMSSSSAFKLPYPKNIINDQRIISDFWNEKEKGMGLISYAYSFEDKNAYFNYVFEYSELRHLPDDVKSGILLTEGYAHSVAIEKNSAITVSSFLGKLLSGKENEILKRFAKVFEQAYIRFLDLQKAEAQAREAQIELGLERVRARAMAMQKSDELSELVDTVFKELTKLDFALTWCIINIIDESSMSNTVWAANPDINKPPESYHMLFEDYPFHHAMMKGWKERKIKDVYILEGQDKKIYDEYLFNETEFRRVPAAAQAASRAMEKYVVTFSFSNFGGLQTVGDAPLLDANLDILSRFGKVFDLTYTRFNDLKQAEAQARESQIQLALERVRARTMAMQKSDELKYAATLLFQQAKALGVPAYSCGYNIWEKGAKEFTSWMSTQDGSDINGVPNIPLTEDANFIRYVESKQNDEPFFVLELRGERMQEHYQYLKTIPAFKGYFDYAISVGFDLPQTQIHHIANFSQGNLLFITLEPCPEFHDVFKRFAAVFEQTYTRFLDLQKAEAQAREAQVEAALEKVRARTMGMQRSDELAESAVLLFHQLMLLGLDLRGCGFNIWEKDEKTCTAWMSGPEGKLSPPFKLPLTEDPFFIRYYESRQNGEDFWIYETGEKELVSRYQYMRTLPVLGELLANDLKDGIDLELPPLVVDHVVNFSNGNLIFITYKPCPEAWDIFKRFGKVFEQTYTRFLDLQKAEARAREAKIEVALERTRTQSMIMQHSKELDDTLRVFHEQVLLLGINSAFSFLWLPDEEEDRHIFWAVWEENNSKVFKSKAVNYPLDRNEPATAQCLVDWKSNEPVYSYHVPSSAVENYFAIWQELIDGVEQLKPEYFSSGLYYVEAFMKYGCFGVMVATDLTEDEKKILGRFAIEFERTYTRFLDLKKAEAQAREAKIEAALEKVRSKTMAMHNSQDVGDTVAALFDEFVKLGIETFRCGIGIVHQEKKMEVWTAKRDANGKVNFFTGYMDMTMHPLLEGSYSAWKKKQEFYLYELKGDDLKEYFSRSNNNPNYPLKYDIPSLPSRLIFSVFYFPEGFLFAFTLEELPAETTKIFKRFSGVFGQTYRRYLDLQKAEAQAREAQIEAALERVRSRSMAMQKSEELKEVIQVVYEQFIYLNMQVDHTGFIMDYNERHDMHIWLADKHAVPFQVTIPYFDSEHWNSFNEAKEKGKNFFSNNLSFEEKNTFYLDLFKHIPGVTEETKEYYFNCPGLAISTVLLDDVGLYIENFSGISYTDEENNTLMRFGKVFQQTYTRFLDLQKAEAQVKEATKQASLDRVRGQIASMRSTEDLQRITPLIWHELTMLDVPFIRCGVLIIDERKSEAHIYLSSPDGHPLAAMNLPLQSNTLTANSVEYWRKGLVYTEHWDKEDFTRWMQSMIAQGHVQNTETYQGSAKPPESLHLHFVPFTQGMLYVGNTTLLTNDEIDPVKSLAEAFSIAYARYEDFIKLEKAKQSIEVTLTELKATQTQLIQSEKMASLGELTAGIAHEIQNPLNFVNNFSDVNKELLAELTEEIEKGNYEEVKILAKDVIGNEEKISHHGRRADAIVKGMLQHSRSSSGKKEPADINALADEYLRLAYHGLRAKDKSFNATLKTDYDETLEKVNVIPQDIGRVVLNLITNAFYAIHEKAKQQTNLYEPTITIVTKKSGDKVSISVKDNGGGISQKVVDKIFQPFFTTKPTGQGTGLGLSLSYDIVKAHGGEIKVETNEGDGSEFIIQLPING